MAGEAQTVVNPTESIQKLQLTVKRIGLKGQGQVWHIPGPGIEATTGLTKHEVEVKEALVGEVPATLEVAPISVDLYEFERR